MDKNLKFNSSLKEFCLGRTKKEIRDYFKDNFLEDTGHIYANGLYYKCAIDIWWENDDDVCTDLWIDWEMSDIGNS